jgi:hypothetical protein
MLLASLAACSRPTATADLARGAARPEDRMAALRFAVASDPRDADARAALGVALAAAGRRGEALEQLLAAGRARELAGGPRQMAAELLVERARGRIAARDAAAWVDLALARRLGASAVPGLELAAARLALVTSMARTGATPSQVAAHAARLARLAPHDPLLAALAPRRVTPAVLGEAGRAAWRGGARRLARELLAAYVERGGREAKALGDWLAAERWWGGRRSALSPIVLDAAGAAGVDVCASAYQPDDKVCARHARPTPGLLARAESLGWRTAEPRVAAALVGAGARAWLSGDGQAWLESVASHLRLPELFAALDRVPLYARASIARLAGDREAASAALARALRAAAALAPAERATVYVEAVVQGASDATLAAVAASGQLPSWAQLARAARARAAGDRAGEAEALVAAGDAAARFLAERGALAQAAARSSHWRGAARRWQDAVALARGEPSAWPSAIMSAPFAPEDELRALARIAAAFHRDPAAGERLAEDWVGQPAYAGPRLGLLVELLQRIGEPGRARQWSDRLLELAPEHAPYLIAAGIAAAAAGEPERAGLLFVDAAARSGDPGAVYGAAADTLARHSYGVEALGMSRRALALTADGEDVMLRRRAAALLEEHGRRGDALALPAGLDAGDDAVPAPSVAVEPEPAWALATARATTDRGEAARVLERALAWSPRRIQLWSERFALADGAGARGEQLDALLALAVSSHGRVRVEALRAAASAARAMGIGALAGAAERALELCSHEAAGLAPISDAAASAAGGSARRTPAR